MIPVAVFFVLALAVGLGFVFGLAAAAGMDN